jgi:sugar lactone lactonase YvrE
MTIARNPPDDRIVALAASGGYVYWTVPSTFAGSASNEPTGSVLRVPVGGGKVQILAEAQALPGAITVDDSSTVYWLNQGKSGIDCPPERRRTHAADARERQPRGARIESRWGCLARGQRWE